MTVKYQRNNHGPGGFIRFTLVPVEKMMDKSVHARNAFHYSCWGANPVVAKPNEKGRDKFGFSLVGGDGASHNLPKAYYTVNITIPPVIPDGDYVLGWVWFGGVGGSISQNKPSKPYPLGLFGDYWSCAFVKIKGGKKLESEYRPEFVNDMQQYWKGGCHAAQDSPGKCVYEPCMDPAQIQVPGLFKNGKRPPILIPKYFKRSEPRKKILRPTPVPYRAILQDALVALSRYKTGEAGGGKEGMLTQLNM